MGKADHLWRTLELYHDASMVMVFWMKWLGPDFSFAQFYLKPTKDYADEYPCPSPGGPGCPRQVVRHGPDDIVAVCGNHPKDCDRLELKKTHIALYRLDLVKFCAEIATALDFEAATLRIARVLNLGVVTIGSGDYLPVFLVLARSADEFRRAVIELISMTGPFVLLTPTSHRIDDSASIDLMKDRGSFYGVLDELLRMEPNGRFSARISLAAAIGSLEGVAVELEPKMYVFRRNGAAWEITFRGESVPPIPHVKGMTYVAVLLRESPKAFYPADIPTAAGEGVTKGKTREALDAGLDLSGEGDAGESLDGIALQQYNDRLKGIEVELVAARQDNDEARVQPLVEEKEIILDQIRVSTDKRGRPRKLRKRRKSERDRVINNIARALKRIRAAHPALAAHLAESIVAGEMRSYRPKTAVEWAVSL